MRQILLPVATCLLLKGFSLDFVPADHPILEKVAKQIDLKRIEAEEIQRFFDKMLAFGRGEQSDSSGSVMMGLAAPQIGVDMRVILVDVAADGKGGCGDLRLYVNPEILELSQDLEEWYEGCYSTGDVKGVVKRPTWVKIRAYDRYGNEVVETRHGYVGRIFQHEIDHLNGKRFPERMKEDEMIDIVTEDQIVEFRNKGGWRNWDIKVPVRDWKQFI